MNKTVNAQLTTEMYSAYQTVREKQTEIPKLLSLEEARRKKPKLF